MIFRLVVPMELSQDENAPPGAMINQPKYLRDFEGVDGIEWWSKEAEFDTHGPDWKMLVQISTEDPTIINELRAKPDVEEAP